jgi:Lon protease-like protein
MRTRITQITGHEDGLEVTMVVYWRHLPRPDYEGKETDEQYAERVKGIAKDIDGYNNLHIGWADLTQEPDIMKIPTVAEYDT